ncbi:MAG TPA: isochorismatase family protein [Terriglobia bacterium]|nr:isochorismatase family protein [Terriglobia bacterium]
MEKPLVFFDVDTQVDFMEPKGSLYVPRADEIRPHLKQLFDYALERKIPILSSADAHPSDDPSFAQWPPHCVVGTPGQKRIPETWTPNAVVVPNQPGAFAVPKEWPSQIIIEKQEYDASTNANFDAIVHALGERTYVVFGVATEYCVRSTALSLLKKGLPVVLVTDAIKAIDEDSGRKAIEELAAAGARLVSTSDVCQ